MKVLLTLIVVIAVVEAGPVPSDCMACICAVESNCNSNIGCNVDRGSYSCGPFQIKQPYYTDALTRSSNLGSGWVSCTTNKACAERTVQAYMTRYATYSRLRHTPTCEDFARIHNGGPNGYRYSSTIGYWNRVSACLR
ncbi:lysozyme-like isoform X2 [Apostichopus japonicus]